ncbi:MAG: hypothetical protein Ta2G_05820 [Termitinemataceae bacterium]|nr:MAG: hypothetical protein Ta2G_05820 [Termitinemataceae bacterium]
MKQMDQKDAFERLSSSLHDEDKIRLLEKIKEHSEVGENRLFEEERLPQSENNEVQFARLSFCQRMINALVAFFTGKSSMAVFVSDIVSKEGRAIDLAYPGIYDYQQSLLKEDFQVELKKLKEAARFFYTALDSSVNRRQGDFFVFLGSIELPDVHNALLSGTDPSVCVLEHPLTALPQVRKIALSFIEKTLGQLSPEDRSVMYQNARSLLYLKQLASFLYDRFILSFNKQQGGNDLICPVSLVKNQLISLCNILYSLRNPPSLNLLSAMFVFIMQEHINEDGFEEDEEMQKFTNRAEKALGEIRTFNRRVPIVRILRCATRDMSFAPVQISCAEDWFTKYRDTWIKNVNEAFDVYIIQKRKAKIDKLYIDLFDNFKIEPFRNVQTDENDDGIPVEQIKNISILLAFHKKIFMPEINVVLRPILINGNFQKKENRIEFTESYNVLIRLDDSIKSFTDKLSANGEFGKRWEQLNGEVQSVTVRRRKSTSLFEEIEYIERNIIEETYKQLIIMEKILSGIVGTKEDSSYGILTNIPEISGKGTTFADGLNAGLVKLKKMVILVNEIRNINNPEQ